MTLITRPTKTGGGPDVLAGNDVLAEEWDGDLNTIYNDYNGLITNANIKADAAILFSKFADAPNGATTSKINDNAVTSAKLQSDATVDANRAVTTNHIKDLAITPAKIIASGLIKSNLKLSFFAWIVPNGNVAADGIIYQDTGLLAVNILPLGVRLYQGVGGTPIDYNMVAYPWWDTTTDKIYLVIKNTKAVIFNPNGLRVILDYLQAS